MEFEFCPEKNIKLMNQRGISFEEIIYYINAGYLVDFVKHPNKRKYEGQLFYVVDVDGYIYLVPFVREGSKIFLKTIFPSRKYTKKSGAPAQGASVFSIGGLSRGESHRTLDFEQKLAFCEEYYRKQFPAGTAAKKYLEQMKQRRGKADE